MIKLLITDDSALMRRVLEDIFLEEGDFQIRLARNGTEAIELVRSFDPQVVTLDVQMPGMTGFEVLQALPPDISPAIIFTTAYDQFAIEAFDINAADYLLKPFRQDDVLAAITTAQARSAELADARNEAKSLAEALETRRFVERAKGMLMQTESISEADAYARMRSASQRTGQPMRAIAEALLATLSGEP